MGRYYKMEDGDAELVRELSKTMGPSTLAHKWEVSVGCMKGFCKRHGIHSTKIMREYRRDTVLEFGHLSSGKIAYKLDIAPSTVAKIRRDIANTEHALSF